MQTTKPAKQRKAMFQAPSHRRHRLFAAPLSSTLRSTHGVKSFPVRSGDTVRVMRGDHEGFEGKITRIAMKEYRIYIEGLTREKVDGTLRFVAVHPSKVMITNMNLDDKWRKEILARKKATPKRAEAPAEKPAAKPVKEAVEVTEAKEPVAKKTLAEEKPAEKKPKAPKKRTAKKPDSAKKEKKTEETPAEEKPKVRKPRAKRKTAEKTEGGT